MPLAQQVMMVFFCFLREGTLEESEESGMFREPST